MDVAQAVELDALLEKLEVVDLPVVAAKLLETWCATKGSDHDAIFEFYSVITDLQSGAARQQLDLMSTVYTAAKFSPLPRGRS